MAETYLYGAAVQGIQNFIFQTDKLKRIGKASEIVEEICTTVFKDFEKNGESVVRAAGNIKHLFYDRKSCEKAVKDFPRKVMEMAPGITISQAVVKMDGDFDTFSKAIDELERLLHIQRNKPIRPLNIGLTGIYHAQDTGLPIDELYKDNSKQESESALKLYKNSFGIYLRHNQIAYNIEEITENNDWIAVIHADGNGVGKIVQAIGKDSESLKQFSEALDNVTKLSAQFAFNAVKERFNGSKIIPIRPIILGGDDITIICRANIAIDYTKAFISSFEENSKQQLGTLLTKNKLPFNCLTVCAGISYVKSSYPFHYGVRLADSLCSRAKNDAKKKENLVNELAPSCLIFHKVQDSFIEDYQTIIERELTTKDGATFEFGPYYLHDKKNRWTIDNLINMTLKLNETNNGNAVKSHLRQWLSVRINNRNEAKQKIDRLKSILGNTATLFKLDEITSETDKRIPVYDMLSLHTILNQKTK